MQASWGALGVLSMSLLLLGSGQKLAAQAAISPESQVEAVFLYNFARFVSWPPRAFPDPQAPLVIGVLGEDPFGAYLDETVRGEKVNGRPLVVQRYRRVGEIKACHVLFISKSEGDRLEQILAALRGRSILTVSDADGFTGRGGMIRFLTEKNKVRMQVNLDVVKSANLNVSSKLLRVAEIQH
jgi:YfiR/HmsC-like